MDSIFGKDAFLGKLDPIFGNSNEEGEPHNPNSVKNKTPGKVPQQHKRDGSLTSHLSSAKNFLSLSAWTTKNDRDFDSVDLPPEENKASE